MPGTAPATWRPAEADTGSLHMELTGNPPNAEYRRFEGNREYEDIIDRTLNRAWNGSARIELLHQFLLADRTNRLLIVLHDTRPLGIACPRLIGLAQQFSHACSIRETLRAAKHVQDPFVISDGSHYVHRFHYDHLRAAQGTHDVIGAQQLIERFAEIGECAGPPLAANVTGL